MRRAANPTRKISITLPGSTFTRLEQVLSYDQSRSAYITRAIDEMMNSHSSIDISDVSTEDILGTLEFRFGAGTPEDVLIQSLLQIFSKKS